MMLSIITVNYNNDTGLHRTIKSVQSQNTKLHFQHIIIDGASTDRSLDIMNEYKSQAKGAIVISEKDNGIYNAMNKGLSLASGNHVAFLNSGDVLAHNEVINDIYTALKRDSSIDFLYGNLCFVDDNNTVTRVWNSGEFIKSKIYFGWMPPHPMTVIRKTVFDDRKNFDERLQIAADYDLMLRVLLASDLVVEYIPKIFVYMELGGASNKSLLSIIKSNVEVVKSWIKVRGYITPYWIFLTKPLYKLHQLRRLKI